MGTLRSSWWGSWAGWRIYLSTLEWPEHGALGVASAVFLLAVGIGGLILGWHAGSSNSSPIIPVALVLVVASEARSEFSLPVGSRGARISFVGAVILWSLWGAPGVATDVALVLGIAISFLWLRTPLTNALGLTIGWVAAIGVVSYVASIAGWSSEPTALVVFCCLGVGLELWRNTLASTVALITNTRYAELDIFNILIAGGRGAMNGLMAWSALVLLEGDKLFWGWGVPLLVLTVSMAWRMRRNRLLGLDVETRYQMLDAWDSPHMEESMARTLATLARRFRCDELHCYLRSLTSRDQVDDYSWSPILGPDHTTVKTDVFELLGDAAPPRLTTTPVGRSAGVAAVMRLPLIYEQRRIGECVLTRMDFSRPPWTQDDLDDAADLMLLLRDLINHQQLLSNLEYMSHHDDLTGLANQIGLFQAIDEVGRDDEALRSGLLYLDINHFKEINDTLGHEIGDRAIGLVAERMSRVVKGRDVVARLHGDEFAVLAGELNHKNHLQAIAERIAEVISEPSGLPGEADVMSASIGGVYQLPRSLRPDEQLAVADWVMYQVKRSGGKKPVVLEADQAIALADNHDVGKGNALEKLRIQLDSMINT
jgi:diguanylate cyclase (GGDEF)-like protein